jgi:hypothetical protein
MRDCVVFDPEPQNRVEDYAHCIHLYPEYDEEHVQPWVVALSGMNPAPSTDVH